MEDFPRNINNHFRQRVTNDLSKMGHQRPLNNGQSTTTQQRPINNGSSTNTQWPPINDLQQRPINDLPVTAHQQLPTNGQSTTSQQWPINNHPTTDHQRPLDYGTSTISQERTTNGPLLLNYCRLVGSLKAATGCLSTCYGGWNSFKDF